MIRFPRTILGTVCIPWLEDYSFDEAMFRQEIRFLVESGLNHLYIFGTAGEGYAVDNVLFEYVTQVFVEEMQGCEALPMVGVISLSLRTIIERIERASALGIRHFQISLPSWGTLSEQEAQIFFREICGRFPDLQFLHYNLQRAGRLITPAEYAVLAAEHENLVATKISTRDTVVIHSLLEKAPQLRHFFTEPGFAYSSLLGESGLLISVASSNPARAHEYFKAGVTGDTKTLIPLQRELMAMINELMGAVGAQAHMDGAYDKIFCKLHQPDFPLRLLPPYTSSSEKAFTQYANALRSKFPQWLPSK